MTRSYRSRGIRSRISCRIPRCAHSSGYFWSTRKPCSSASKARTRARISSRVFRTESIPCPLGSGNGQSSRRRPGTYGQSSPQPIVISNLCIVCQILGQLLRFRVPQVNTNFEHGFHNHRMNLLRRLSSGGNCNCPFWIGKLVKECSRHLRTSCVVYTREDYFLHVASICSER